MPTSINPEQLKRTLTDGGEFALLDVRERGQYARGHLFLAINLPLSYLELRMRRYVPRLTARVILCDGGNGLAERAAWVMAAAGYGNIAIVEGGAPVCGAAGMELFRGHYATTYAFGLYVDRHYRPPAILPQVLKARVDAGESVVILDSRPLEEFGEESIPGAIDAPLGELAYRIRDIAPDPETQLVVNCGAITRGVLGGRTLIEAGVENPVAVLVNGARGWDLANFELARGATRSAGHASQEAATWAMDAAKRVAHRTGVRFISAAELDHWREDEERTLFTVDVRTRQEYETGHLEGAIWISGGELIGCYEDHIGTLNARVCLVDDDGARAIVTASWLGRMGWPDVAVLAGGLDGQTLVSGPERAVVPELEAAGVPVLSPAELAARMAQADTLVIDFAGSVTHEKGHIPGAWWTVRSNLPEVTAKLPAADCYVATSEDGRLALLAAQDLQQLTAIPVMTLAGGTEAWRAAGHQTLGGMIRPLGEIDDVLAEFAVRPGDDRATVLASQRRMLQWQEELLEKVERDVTFDFPPLP